MSGVLKHLAALPASQSSLPGSVNCQEFSQTGRQTYYQCWRVKALRKVVSTALDKHAFISCDVEALPDVVKQQHALASKSKPATKAVRP